MQEFSSISVSSYDAASLAGKLTEKSAEGWDVVAIVSAGTNVTAYLSRAASEGVDQGGTSEDVATSTTDGSTDTGSPAPSTYEPILPIGGESEPSTPSPVEEPAGWASEPEPTPAAPTPEPATSWSSTTTEPSPAAPSPEPVPVAPEPEPEPEPEPQPVQTAAAAPAGWYADPSGRYELRYWDGSQWTEHVSRAGQQYTDPPVA
jgi:hypothetical protein